MSNENLKRAAEEIKAALETALTAERTSSDPELSFISGETFNQIARPLRRALRLITGKPQQTSRDERDADLLFDAYHSGGDAHYEIGCVLDNDLNAAERGLDHRHIFTAIYLDAIREGKSDEMKFILRELRKGTDPKVIATKLDYGGLK